MIYWSFGRFFPTCLRLFSECSFAVSVDDKPVLIDPSDVNKTEDDGSFTVELSASDNDGDSISYVVTSLDRSIATVTLNGTTLTINPVANANGTVSIEVNATANGVTVTQTFGVNVTAVNDTPIIDRTFSSVNMQEDNGTTNYELNVSDVDRDNLTLNVESNDTSLITVGQKWTNPITNGSYQGLEFNLTTVENANGVARITLTLSDGEVNTTKSFEVNVGAVNDAPTIITNLLDISLEEDNGTTTYPLVVSDVDLDELNVTIESNNTNILTVTPSWSGLLNSANWNQEFNLTTVPNAHGVVEITVMVNDGELNTTTSFNVTISEVSDNIVVPYQENGDDVNTSVLFDENLEDVEINENEANINVGSNNIRVNVESSGEANVSITFDSGSVSQVVIYNTQSQTNVDASGNVKTTLTIDNQSSVETRLNVDGTVTHIVQYRGEVTEATSSISGATVKIDENGTVETESELEKNGFIYKAIVSTNTKGETSTKFIKVNVATGAQEDLSHTLKDGVSFESGNSPEVIELNDLIYIKVTTPLDNGILVVE